MRTTIDRSGRLVVPKEMREQAGLKAGDTIEIEATSEGLRLTPVHDSPRLVKDGNVLVFAGGTLDRSEGDGVEQVRTERVAELVRQAIS